MKNQIVRKCFYLFLSSAIFPSLLHAAAPKECPVFSGLEINKMVVDGGTIIRRDPNGSNEWKFYKDYKFSPKREYRIKIKEAPLPRLAKMIDSNVSTVKEYIAEKITVGDKFSPYEPVEHAAKPELITKTGISRVFGKKNYVCSYPIMNPRANPNQPQGVEVVIGTI